MVNFLKSLAVILTVLLLGLFFWGIASGAAYRSFFWLSYVFLLLLNLSILKQIKKKQL